MDFAKMKLNISVNSEASRGSAKYRNSENVYPEVHHVPLSSEWRGNAGSGDGQGTEKKKKKVKRNCETPPKQNCWVQLRPGHYQLSVHWSSKQKPACVTIAPESSGIDAASAHDDQKSQQQQQSLLYESGSSRFSPSHLSTSSSSSSSFPRRIVNRLFPSSSGGRGDFFLRAKSWGSTPSRKRPGGCMENRSRHCQRKSKYRWASLSCIHFTSLDDDEGGLYDDFGGYEGVEHLKRTSFEEVLWGADDLKGPELYFINSFASSQCQSLLDIYSTSASTAHVCKLSKVAREVKVSESSSTAAGSLDALIGRCERSIGLEDKFLGEPTLETIERKTWHEQETFLSQIVDEYFKEAVPVPDLENILGTCKVCSDKRARCSAGRQSRSKVLAGPERFLWSTTSELALRAALAKEVQFQSWTDTEGRLGRRKEKRLPESFGGSSCKEMFWCSEESLGYMADTEGSDGEMDGDVVRFRCRESPFDPSRLRRHLFKKSPEMSPDSKSRLEFPKEIQETNLKRRYTINVDSLVNYRHFTDSSGFNSSTLPNLFFKLKNIYSSSTKVCPIESTLNIAEYYNHLANKSPNFIELSGQCGSARHHLLNVSLSSVSDVDSVLSKGLVINRSEVKFPVEVASSLGAAREGKNFGHSFINRGVNLASTLCQEGRRLTSKGFPVTTKVFQEELGELGYHRRRANCHRKLAVLHARDTSSILGGEAMIADTHSRYRSFSKIDPFTHSQPFRNRPDSRDLKGRCPNRYAGHCESSSVGNVSLKPFGRPVEQDKMPGSASLRPPGRAQNLPVRDTSLRGRTGPLKAALLGKLVIIEGAPPPPSKVSPDPHLECASCSLPQVQGASLVPPLLSVPSLAIGDRVRECPMGSALSTTEGKKSSHAEDSPGGEEKGLGRSALSRPPRSRKYFSEIFDSSPFMRVSVPRRGVTYSSCASSYGGERGCASFAHNFDKGGDVGDDRLGHNLRKCGSFSDKQNVTTPFVPDSSEPNGGCQESKELWTGASPVPDSSGRFKKLEVKSEKSILRSHSYVSNDHNFLSEEFGSRVSRRCREQPIPGDSDGKSDPTEKSPCSSSSPLYENSYFYRHRYVGELSYVNSFIEGCGYEGVGVSCPVVTTDAPSHFPLSLDAAAFPSATGAEEGFCARSDRSVDALAPQTPPPASLSEDDDASDSTERETSESSSGKFSFCRSESSDSVASDASSSFYYTAGGSELIDEVEAVTEYFSVIGKKTEQEEVEEEEQEQVLTNKGLDRSPLKGREDYDDADSKTDAADIKGNDCPVIIASSDQPLNDVSSGDSNFAIGKSDSGSSFAYHEYVNANVIVKDNQILVTIKPGVESFPPDHLKEQSSDHEYETIQQDRRCSGLAERPSKPPTGKSYLDEGLVHASPCVTHSDSENEIKVFSSKASLTVHSRPEVNRGQSLEKSEIRVDIGGVRISPLRECLSDSDLKLSEKEDLDFDDESSLYATLTTSDEGSESIPTSGDDVSSLTERLSSPSPDPGAAVAFDGPSNCFAEPLSFQTEGYPMCHYPMCHTSVEVPTPSTYFTATWNRVDLKPSASPFVAFDPTVFSPVTSYFPLGFSPPVSPADAKKPPPFPHRGRESSSLPREAQSEYRMRRRCRSVSSADTSRRGNRRRVVSLIKTSQEFLHDRRFCPAAGDRAPDIRWVAERKKAEGNELYKKKHYREAIKLYTEAIELCPECASYYSNRSACHMMMGKYIQALSDAREAIRLDSSFVKGYIRIGKCNIALGDANAALSVLRQATELEPGSKAVRDEVANASALIRFGEEVEKAIAKKDYRTAIYHIDRALDLAVGCRTLKITKAEYLVYLQRHPEAQEIVNEILQFDSANVDAICVRGMCLYYQDNQEAAFTHFQHVLKLAPDHKKAKEMYKKAKLLKVKKEEGNQAFNKGNLREALNLYTEALSIDVNNKTTNSKLYCNRAAVKAKLGKSEEAVDDCTAAINLNEKYVKAYLRRAKCYQDLEKHEEAVRDYERVCKQDRNQEYSKLLQDAKVQLKCSKRKDYYKILGVSRNATEDDIKKSYKKMALQHHPDRHANASDKEKQDHEIKFKEIGEAYAVLTDPKKKAMYDRGQDINDPDYGFGHDDVDPNQIFQAFFSSGGSNFSFQHQGFGGGFPSSGFGGGGFPGGFHFQFG